MHPILPPKIWALSIPRASYQVNGIPGHLDYIMGAGAGLTAAPPPACSCAREQAAAAGLRARLAATHRAAGPGGRAPQFDAHIKSGIIGFQGFGFIFAMKKCSKNSFMGHDADRIFVLLFAEQECLSDKDVSAGRVQKEKFRRLKAFSISPGFSLVALSVIFI
jgi:hypothetical protein